MTEEAADVVRLLRLTALHRIEHTLRRRYEIHAAMIMPRFELVLPDEDQAQDDRPTPSSEK